MSKPSYRNLRSIQAKRAYIYLMLGNSRSWALRGAQALLDNVGHNSCDRVLHWRYQSDHSWIRKMLLAAKAKGWHPDCGEREAARTLTPTQFEVLRDRVRMYVDDLILIASSK